MGSTINMVHGDEWVEKENRSQEINFWVYFHFIKVEVQLFSAIVLRHISGVVGEGGAQHARNIGEVWQDA